MTDPTFSMNSIGQISVNGSGERRTDYGRIALALGFLFLTGTASSDHGQQRDPDHRQTAAAPVKALDKSDARKDVQEACMGAGRPDLTCEAISAQASFDQARDADAGFWLGVIQIILAAATFGAAIFAGYWAMRAAKHTKTGAQEAEKAATAAINQLLLSTHAQRPWIDIEPSISIYVSDRNAEMLVVDGQLIFKNIGATVAARVSIKGGTCLTDEGLKEQRITFDENRTLFKSHERAIMPKGSVAYKFQSEFARRHFSEIVEDGRIRISLFALCDYYSSEGTQYHVTDALWEIRVRGESYFEADGIPLDPIPDPSDIELHGGPKTVS